MQAEKIPLNELISKYLEGQCTPEEESLLNNWIINYSGAGHPAISDSTGILLKKRIDQANGQAIIYQSHSWFTTFRYAAASVILLIACTGIWYFNPQLHTETEARPMTNVAAIHFSKVINNGVAIKRLTLEDGSVVKLAPKSTLLWQVPFAKNIRKIELEGKAFFSVSKNKHKPFVVYTGDISTTALGTSFWIDELVKNKINIQLVTGKVLISQWKDKTAMAYLNPGQELSYHVIDRTAVVSKTEKRILIQRTGDHNAPLIFSNTPLNEVFGRLQSAYHINIDYNRREVQSMTFYGEYTTRDELKDILKTIAAANDLTVRQTNNKFTISK